MSLYWDQVLENAIIGKAIAELIDNGYRIEMSDNDGGGLYIYAIPNNGPPRPEGGYSHWVKLEPGNGASVISDYTTNLESALKNTNAFAEVFID